jgi:D-aspartate ligase
MKSITARPQPPAVILGGHTNALSIARSLGGAGIRTYAINNGNAVVQYSRFCQWIGIQRRADTLQETWAAYLLGPESDHLRGAVLLAACDEAVELIANHRRALSEKFRLDLSNPKAQLCMLNKLSTYQAAREAGVPTPRFWLAERREQVEKLEHELVFPLVVKPLLSHQFKNKFSGAAFVVVHRFAELLEAFDAIDRAGIQTFLVEMIPGPDDKLCSYYSYLDETGNSLFDYTKRVIRRYPMNMGAGAYHITDHVPGVKELSLKLFRHVGLQGIGNAEFKLDSRDGQLKLIECNARFTAADCLLVASGLNLSLFVYNRIIGRAPEPPASFRTGLRLWYPADDFRAYRELRRNGLLTFREWLASVCHFQIFPIFRWKDPLPAFVQGIRHLQGTLSRLSRARRRRQDREYRRVPGSCASAPTK